MVNICRYYKDCLTINLVKESLISKHKNQTNIQAKIRVPVLKPFKLTLSNPKHLNQVRDINHFAMDGAICPLASIEIYCPLFACCCPFWGQ